MFQLLIYSIKDRREVLRSNLLTPIPTLSNLDILHWPVVAVLLFRGMGVSRPIAAMSRCVTGGAGVDDVRGMCWLHIFHVLLVLDAGSGRGSGR